MTKRLKTAMPVAPASAPEASASGVGRNYTGLITGIAQLLDDARRVSARAVNAVMTASYWEIGRRIEEFEQGGKSRAEYGHALLKRLSRDLTRQLGRGFSERNLEQMRGFYLAWPISQTLSAKSPAKKPQTPSAKSDVATLVTRFPLPWSHYAREHWAHPDENPPAGLILCAQKDAALARYALENLPNKILAAEYKVALPAEKTLAAEIDRTRRILEARAGGRRHPVTTTTP